MHLKQGSYILSFGLLVQVLRHENGTTWKGVLSSRIFNHFSSQEL